MIVGTDIFLVFMKTERDERISGEGPITNNPAHACIRDHNRIQEAVMIILLTQHKSAQRGEHIKKTQHEIFKKFLTSLALGSLSDY